MSYKAYRMNIRMNIRVELLRLERIMLTTITKDLKKSFLPKKWRFYQTDVNCTK